MASTGTTSQGVIREEGWPCQRLRVAFSLILFCFFELLIGRRLPEVMPILCLGAGIACLASAIGAIREWKLAAQLGLIQQALDQRAKLDDAR